jgi:DNA-binding NtrC family response regulator
MLSGKSFDAVILDLTIRGGMGGAETVKKLREMDPDVRAIASSGYSDDAVVSAHQEQGFKAFLRKPYSLDTLREVLNNVLKS